MTKNDVPEMSGNTYYYYHSKLAVVPVELQDLYRFTRWGRSRSLEQIDKMQQSAQVCVSLFVIMIN